RRRHTRFSRDWSSDVCSSDLPVLLVQHMPPPFTAHLARGLAARCRIAVAEARAGEPLVAGRALIAPADWHLGLAAGAPPRVALAIGRASGREKGATPAVDGST